MAGMGCESHSGSGSLRPHLGATLNFIGETSAIYGGLTYERALSRKSFGAVAASPVVHNGPLHKEPEVCDEDSDCGFGSRVLPRFAVEAGMRPAEGETVSLFFDHLSDAGFLADENEGIDHIGIRYRHSF